jgi:hypothetical protein
VCGAQATCAALMSFYDDLLLHTTMCCTTIYVSAYCYILSAYYCVPTDTLRGAGGVSTMMVGQAFIKSLAFACNDWALHWQGVCVSQAIVCP